MQTDGTQQEIPGIDDTPLGRALIRAVDVRTRFEAVQHELDEAKQEVAALMRKLKRDKIVARGFQFQMKWTPAKEKLDIKRF